MIKHVLVPSNGLEANLLEDAFKLATPLSAHVDVLHVGWEPRQEMPLYDKGFSPDTLDTMLRKAQCEADTIASAAKRTFEEFTATASVPVATRLTEAGGVTAEWRQITQSVVRAFVAEARAADLTLLSRPTDKSANLEIFEAALFESGRPVLLRAGDLTRLSSSVVIAWDDSLAAARAVSGAQDFIARADVVTILIVEEGRAPSPAAIARHQHPRAERLVKHLAWHGVEASVLSIKRDGRSVGEALAATAMEMNAGLLVMGGYGHSRLREIILGGATRYMLNHPIDCPVLLAH
ncbi:universal stress protein [Skermanella rosea]|uniref:universal stress protein n=1 Tax=Skermanella rosea TaxID=1817965 RepID=UPI0019325BA9|nr:universal stress protein [Skermanella rosea]UEM03371.1 universal stress protein [Skermanella rosea]